MFPNLPLLTVLTQPLTLFPGCTGQHNTAALDTISSALLASTATALLHASSPRAQHKCRVRLQTFLVKVLQQETTTYEQEFGHYARSIYVTSGLSRMAASASCQGFFNYSRILHLWLQYVAPGPHTDLYLMMPQLRNMICWELHNSNLPPAEF